MPSLRTLTYIHTYKHECTKMHAQKCMHINIHHYTHTLDTGHIHSILTYNSSWQGLRRPLPQCSYKMCVFIRDNANDQRVIVVVLSSIILSRQKEEVETMQGDIDGIVCSNCRLLISDTSLCQKWNSWFWSSSEMVHGINKWDFYTYKFQIKLQA